MNPNTFQNESTTNSRSHSGVKHRSHATPGPAFGLTQSSHIGIITHHTRHLGHISQKSCQGNIFPTFDLVRTNGSACGRIDRPAISDANPLQGPKVPREPSRQKWYLLSQTMADTFSAAPRVHSGTPNLADFPSAIGHGHLQFRAAYFHADPHARSLSSNQVKTPLTAAVQATPLHLRQQQHHHTQTQAH